jgi:hypothetical protein
MRLLQLCLPGENRTDRAYKNRQNLPRKAKEKNAGVKEK